MRMSLFNERAKSFLQTFAVTKLKLRRVSIANVAGHEVEICGGCGLECECCCPARQLRNEAVKSPSASTKRIICRRMKPQPRLPHTLYGNYETNWSALPAGTHGSSSERRLAVKPPNISVGPRATGARSILRYFRDDSGYFRPRRPFTEH